MFVVTLALLNLKTILSTDWKGVRYTLCELDELTGDFFAATELSEENMKKVSYVYDDFILSNFSE